MREIGFPSDHTAVDLLTPRATVAVAVDPSEEVVGASQDAALVLPSLHQPVSPSAPLGTSGQRLDDDVLQQFDAIHRLSELTTAWGTFVTSFGEKLQVSFSKVLSLDVRLSSVLMSCFSLSSLFSFFLRIIPASFSYVKPSVKCTKGRKKLSVPRWLRQKNRGMLLSRRP